MSEVHWRALIAPLNKPDAVGRKIVMGSTPKARPLPLPLRYAPADWGGHAGAISVGSIDRLWVDSGNLWGEGRFDLSDQAAADVVRKIENGFVRHVSADIEPVTGKIMAATIVDIPAFEDAEIKSINIPHVVAEPELMAFQFRVVGDVSLPFADREKAWDSAAAVQRVFNWAGGDNLDVNKFRRAFLYQDENADPSTKAAYKLPFADVVDGELVAVPRGVFAVAGGRGVGAADIPASDKETIRRRVSALYRRMAKQFDDPSIVSPFEKQEMSAVLADRFAVAVRSLRREVALYEGGV